MTFIVYSLGFVAAFVGIVNALPTPPTPSTEDLTPTGTSGVPDVPKIPNPSGTDGNSDGSSFMGIAFDNNIDLGDAKNFPTDTSHLIIGSLQNFNQQANGDNGDNSESSDN